MKKTLFYFSMLAVFIACTKPSAPSVQPVLENLSLNSPKSYAVAATMVHPGGWITVADIQRIRGKLTPWGTNTEPWISAKNALMASGPSYTYQATPVATVTRNSNGASPDGSDSKMRTDATNAYTLMVKWVATNDTRYGDAAIRVLDGWSALLTSIIGSDARLAAGIYGNKFAQAAELAAYYKPSWTNKSRAQQMFTDVFYPIIWNNGHGASSNWGTSCMAGMISMGVFCDNISMFNNAINAYKYGWPISGTDGCAGVTQYIDNTGQCAESGRDQPHTQGGIGHLVETAVTAWNQGTNLFTFSSNRLVIGLEYTANYNLGNTVSWHTFVDPCNLNNRWTSISSVGRGSFSPIYEMAYNYFKLAGVANPFTKQVRDRTGYAPEGSNNDHPGFGTLCFTR